MEITSFKTIERVVKPYKVYNLYHFKPVKGFSLDSRSIEKGEAFVALRGRHKNGHDFIKDAASKGASLIIASRYTETIRKVPQFIVEDSFQALRRIILFLRQKYRKAAVLAVTGSLGKTTTKEMLEFILTPYWKVLKSRGTENNILGVAKTIFSYDNHDLIIFELGTNQKGEIPNLAKLVKPEIGIVTCIKPVHLEGLGSLEQIKQEKLSLFANSPKIKAVLNNQDSLLSKARLKNKIYWFGKKKENELFYSLIKRKNNQVYFKILGKYDLILPLRFEHFIDNCLAALLAAHLLGLPYKDLVERLNSFKFFFAMRMEKVEIDNYTILNDAYNASPESFKKAFLTLKRFKLPKVIVVSDMLELGPKSDYYHRRLASQILKSECRYCLTLGSYAKIVNKQLKEKGYKNAFHFSSHREIANFFKKKINKSESDWLSLFAEIHTRYMIASVFRNRGQVPFSRGIWLF